MKTVLTIDRPRAASPRIPLRLSSFTVLTFDGIDVTSGRGQPSASKQVKARKNRQQLRLKEGAPCRRVQTNRKISL